MFSGEVHLDSARLLTFELSEKHVDSCEGGYSFGERTMKSLLSSMQERCQSVIQKWNMENYIEDLLENCNAEGLVRRET